MDYKTLIHYIVSFFVFILLQVVVFNHIALFGYAVPLLYIYYILKLPTKMNTNLVVLIGFIMGFILDIFCNTLGVHALATTTAAFARAPMLAMFLPRTDDDAPAIPSLPSLGFTHFMRYAISWILFFAVVLFLVEAFNLFQPISLLYKIVGSTLLTLLLVLGIEIVTTSSK